MGITTLPKFSHNEQFPVQSRITAAEFPGVLGKIRISQLYQWINLLLIVDDPVKAMGKQTKSRNSPQNCKMAGKVPTGRLAVDDLPIIHMAAITCGGAGTLSPVINKTWNFL